MDVREGFIVGIFNYCDRWCEACAYTSRCRLFADRVETEASFDPGLRALVASQALFREAPAPPPWLEELMEDLDEAMREPSDEPLERALASDHAAIERRARGYGQRVCRWMDERRIDSNQHHSDPLAVIGWFHTLIPVKIHRALHGLADDRFADRDWPPDHDGSAKVALLGIDRSHAAWHDLVARGSATRDEAASFMADLAWLRDAVERVFPGARAFVRPGFDEPDEVARLNATDF